MLAGTFFHTGLGLGLGLGCCWTCYKSANWTQNSDYLLTSQLQEKRNIAKSENVSRKPQYAYRVVISLMQAISLIVITMTYHIAVCLIQPSIVQLAFSIVYRYK